MRPPRVYQRIKNQYRRNQFVLSYIYAEVNSVLNIFGRLGFCPVLDHVFFYSTESS